MKILSLHIANQKTTIETKGRTWHTGLYKERVPGPLYITSLGPRGDIHAHQEVHGGEGRALYVFSKTAYDFWRPHLQNDIPFNEGFFGENATLNDLDESQITVGDHFALGECLLEVTMPRFPCLLLEHRMRREDGIQLMYDSKKPGVLFRVLKEGFIREGDVLNLKKKSAHPLPLLEFFKNGQKNVLTREYYNFLKTIPVIPEKAIARLEHNIKKETTD